MHDAYYFGGVERWQWFLDSPNDAGLLLVEILPTVWLVRELFLSARSPVGVTACIIVQFLIGFTLGRTMSRGSYVGGFISWGTFVVLRSSETPRRSQFIIELMNLCAITVGVFAANGLDRLAVNHVRHDPAILNRFGIWRGAIRMIAAAPIMGWDRAGTGWHYAQWFRPTAEAPYANNLVSGILDFAARFGLPLTTIAIATIIALPMVTFNSRARDQYNSNAKIWMQWASSLLFRIFHV